ETTASGSYFNRSQGIFVTLTGPTQRTAVPVNSISPNPSGMVLSLTTVPGNSYRIAYKSNLLTTNWADFAGELTANSSSLSWTDLTSRAASQRFYRVFEIH